MQWGEFKSIQDCTQYKIYCLAWLIYHAFTICLGNFSAHSPLCCVSVSLSVSLSSWCCNFSVTALPVIRWRGHGACQISKSAVWPKNKWGGGFKSTDKCRGGSLFNLRVQTLPQDIASVFFFFFHFFLFFHCHKNTNKTEGAMLWSKSRVWERKRSWRGDENIIRIWWMMTNDVIGQILPMGQVLFWLHQHCIIISFIPQPKNNWHMGYPTVTTATSSSFKIFFLWVVHPSCRQSISREISALDVLWTPTTPANILSKHALIKANEGSGRTSRKPTMKRS